MKMMLSLLLVVLSSSISADSKSKSHEKAPYNQPYRVKAKRYTPLESARGYKQTGIASWYKYGKKTANGSRFNPWGLTAAHKTLPLPCKAKVTNLDNNKTIVVTIQDRGPFIKGRLIDLSLGAARKLAITGIARVKVETL
jgi:rare lipoprotein A